MTRLINDLLADGGFETALLASILQRTHDAMMNGTLLLLCVQLWRSENFAVGRSQRETESAVGQEN